MRIFISFLVFHEVLRLDEFADIVEISAHPREQIVGADRAGGGVGERGHDQGMVIGSRRLKAHAFEERVVKVAHL